MAKSKRKAVKGKPITSHPLFPAVVALWFGALFGLGSLAIRPSLIEGLVMRSGIDLIIPAAAPPLGVTARILIALTMASAGAVIGGLLARRMTRPKAEVRVRKRTARAAEENVAESSFRRPISAHDELGASLDAPIDGSNPIAARRRALTVEEDERPFQPHETAPLPCGEQPVFMSDPGTAAPLDLGAFPAPAPAPAAPETAVVAPVHSPAATLDWNAAPVSGPAIAAGAPFAPPAGFSAPTAAPDAFAPPAYEPPAFAPPAYSPPPFAAPGDPVVPPFAAPPVNTQSAAEPVVAEPEPAAPSSEAVPSIFGLAAVDGQVPSEFVRAAGFKTSVFEREPVSPLFTDRQPAAPADFMPAPAAEASPVPFAAPLTQPPAGMSPAVAAAPESAPVPDSPTAAPLPRPADLGMTDLARRLQESMARRRAVRDPGSSLATNAAAAPIMSVPVGALAETASLADPLPAATPEAVLPALADQGFVPPPPFVPFAAEPAVHPAAEPAPAIVQPPLAMPAALRPLSFDLPEDEPDGSPFGLLPPRHLVMTPAAVEPAPEPQVTATEPMGIDQFDAADTADADMADEAAEPTEDAFGSLLSISPAVQRTGFVRIEEPEPAVAAIEPVVIFPGQAPVQPVPVAQVPETPFRRFDSPTIAAQAAPVAATMSAPAVDAAEAEAALRAALANLQRMSGAA